jgi:sarcosine oxidase subunit alpha
VQAIDPQQRLHGAPRTLACDLLAVSGGFSPVVHLHCQAGSRPRWDDALAAFLPGEPAQAERSAGACRGLQTLRECALDGLATGHAAAAAAGFMVGALPAPDIAAGDGGEIRALWLVPHARGVSRAPKQFVDLQNDVTASDIHLAVREGFESIEHVKRYTAMGFGTDQGKTGNINGMGIAAQALGRTIPEVGTTTFRPNYTPVTFGVVAGLELGDAFDPIRPRRCTSSTCGRRALRTWASEAPWYYPRRAKTFAAVSVRCCRPDGVARRLDAGQDRPPGFGRACSSTGCTRTRGQTGGANAATALCSTKTGWSSTTASPCVSPSTVF